MYTDVSLALTASSGWEPSRGAITVADEKTVGPDREIPQTALQLRLLYASFVLPAQQEHLRLRDTERQQHTAYQGLKTVLEGCCNGHHGRDQPVMSVVGCGCMHLHELMAHSLCCCACCCSWEMTSGSSVRAVDML